MERIIFQAPSKDVKHKVTSGRLEDLPLIKLFPEEKILCVQRQHWLVLAQKMLFPPLVLLLPLVLFTVPSLRDLFSFVPHFPLVETYLFLFVLSAFFVFETYLFMNWYYQFYLITTRCLLHIHFFRIGGYYFDEVFLDQISQQEVIRDAPNLIYDLLGLYDVQISFSKLEKPEPFIFQAPSDSHAIEDILEDLTMKEIERKEKRR